MYIIYVMRKQRKQTMRQETKVRKPRPIIYERIYKALDRLLPGGVEGFCSADDGYAKLKAEGFMDLNIDVLNYKEEGHKGTFRISMAHNFVQNGDLMADPDMEIRLYHGHQMAEALTYQQDSLGIYQEVYTTRDRKPAYSPRLKRDLNNFLEQWLKNIKAQGHKVVDEEA